MVCTKEEGEVSKNIIKKHPLAELLLCPSLLYPLYIPYICIPTCFTYIQRAAILRPV